MVRRTRRIVDSVLLLSSGGLATLVAVLIGSQRLSFIDKEMAVWVLLFVPWQILGLSIAKFGTDQMTFARVSGDPRVRVKIRQIVLARFVPAALLFSLLSLVTYESALVALTIFVSIVIDACALSLAADLNARRHFRLVAVAGIANHPMFFGAFVVASLLDSGTIPVACGLFVLASLARLLVLLPAYAAVKPPELVNISKTGVLAGQQVLNYSLFRADQVIVNVLAAKIGLSALLIGNVSQFVFLVRLPEILIGISGALTPMYLPWLYRKFTENRGLPIDKGVFAFFGFLAFVSLVLVGVFCVAWDGDKQLSVARVLPFFVFALLVFPANYLTYKAMREDRLSTLVLVQTCSVVAGLGWFLVTRYFQSFEMLIWLVPVQLTAFLLVGTAVMSRQEFAKI